MVFAPGAGAFTGPSHHTAALQRFVDAQLPVMDSVRAELAAGAKRSHWMWFVFPQLKGLGHSATARHFRLDGRAEAAAFAAHPVLGPRLSECCQLVLALPAGRSAQAVFGSPDDLKLCSSMTLFEAVEPSTGEGIFARVLDRFYRGDRDAKTLDLLKAESSGKTDTKA